MRHAASGQVSGVVAEREDAHPAASAPGIAGSIAGFGSTHARSGVGGPRERVHGRAAEWCSPASSRLVSVVEA
ncbi:hypothetical protein FAIPA1_290064 [Frankia sp. AiPs1]